MNENEFPEEVIRHLRQMADEPPPAPSAALGKFFADPSSTPAAAGVAATLAESGLTGAVTHPTKESRMKTLFARMGMAGRVALITGLIAAAGVGTAAAATAVNLVTDDEPTTSIELPTVTDGDQGDFADDQGDDSQSGAVANDKADDKAGDKAGDDQGDNNQGDNNQGDNAADQSDDNGVVSQSDDSLATTGDDQGDDQGDDNGDDQGDDNSGNAQGDDDQGDDSGNDNSGSSSGSDDQSDDSGDESDGGDSQDD